MKMLRLFFSSKKSFFITSRNNLLRGRKLLSDKGSLESELLPFLLIYDGEL